MNCSGSRTDGSPIVRHRPGTSSLATAILRAVAAVENKPPTSMAPLGDVVDPDALELLLETPDGDAHVAFSYAGHRVVVTDDAVEVY